MKLKRNFNSNFGAGFPQLIHRISCLQRPALSEIFVCVIFLVMWSIEEKVRCSLELNADKELISDAFESFRSRLQKCVEKDGGIFE